MIVAMHHAALACVIRHHQGSPWHTALLRAVASDNLLLASSTTEGQGGGNVRSSAAPLVREGDRVSLERAATVVSYGAEADGIVTTARRSADDAASDQALVVFLKEDYALEPTAAWHTLGMRGTCSAGFALKAAGRVDQILPVGYDKIHAQSMVPVSHLTWASAWAGIAAAAVSRAQSFVRTAARRAGGQMPPGAQQYTKAVAALRSLRATVATGLADFEVMRDDPDAIGALGTQAALNLLKVEASERAVETVMLAMRACGLAGYRTDGEFAMGRHLRDILSAPVMVHNDRILSNIASTTLLSGVPASLSK
jgi:acyl-CoA dehydrogenase